MSASAARDALWADGVDETVEVNQRALIDKILARYSGEFTVFRELLQNADDARSKNIEIRFTTRPTTTTPSAPSTPLAGPGSQGVLPVPSNLPDLEKAEITKWTFRNDGDRFRGEDWNRLKKIAEGNPDESKIGAFGVGFYALFSVTESPFVTSGDEWMGFYWKDGKDQLYVRRGKLPDVSTPEQKWTTFEMDLRDPSPMLTKPFDLAKFIATSITFMTHIRRITVYMDEYRLFEMSKASGLSEPTKWPAKLKTESPLRYMRMASVSSQVVVISAAVSRWVYVVGSDSTIAQEKAVAKSKPAPSFFASLNTFTSFFSSSSPTPTPPVDTRTPLQKMTDLEKLEMIESSVQLQIYTGEIGVKLPPKIASDIERATRKKSPANMSYQIVFTDKSAYDASVKEDSQLKYTDISVFQGVRADLDGSGSARVFIGHATAQSTGVGGHHASRFIPTVEREALDLVDATVSVFNKELLAMGGTLSRVIYETEMESISTAWSRLPSSSSTGADSASETAKAALEDRFTHLLQFFAFRQSTPSPLVSHTMKIAFLAASTAQGITLLSTAGVKPSTEVRRYDEDLYAFLKTIPFLRPSVSSRAETLLASSSSIGPIRAVDMKDILAELSIRALDEQEMVKCLQWRVALPDAIVRQNPRAMTADFLAAATVFLPAASSGGTTKNERVVSLAMIQTYFVSGMGVLKDAPLPPHTLPISLGDALPLPKLANAFGWKPLGPAAWLRFLAIDGLDSIPDEFKLAMSPPFAQKVIETVAEDVWELRLSAEEKEGVKSVLENVNCVPTNLGQTVPRAAYFSNVNIFPDLPIVSLVKAEKQGPVQRLLKDLGVRDHVDLQLIFTRHIASGKWSIPDLIGYFVSIKDTLTKDEMEKLKRTNMFFAANAGSSSAESSATPKRFLASQLHEPSAENVALGIPVLDWNGGEWDPRSPSAQFSFSIGLLKYPSLDTLITIAASEDVTKRQNALKYLLSHFDQHYRSAYSLQTHGRIAFVPTLLADGSTRMLPPVEVFAHPDCALLNFPVLPESLRPDSRKLQILDHPHAVQLVQKLRSSPPATPEAQRKVFEYLAGQVASFNSNHFDALHGVPFILIQNGEKSSFVKPTECYVGSSDNAMHSKLFIFVDPGSARAQSFLVACGVKPEPTPQKVADILLHDPQAFFRLAGSESAYLEELRQLSTSIRHNRIDRRTQIIMRNSPIFLASKLVSDSAKKSSEDHEEDDEDHGVTSESRLMKPSDVVIIDDLVRYRLFKESVWAAPQEDFLEEFYASCGSKPISSLVEESLASAGEGNARMAAAVRELVIERLPLFLHDRNGKPTAFKFAWFKSAENFIVKAVKSLTVQNTLKLGRTNATKSRKASAGSYWPGRGPVVLYIAPGAHEAKPDLVEVAHAICQVMFKQHTGNDSLLLSTILSTELRALKRIGYDVDRIIGQHKQAAEQQKRLEGTMKFDPPAPAAPSSEKSSITSSVTTTPTTSHPPTLPPKPPIPAFDSRSPIEASSSSSGGLKSSFDSLRHKILPNRSSSSSLRQGSSTPGIRPPPSRGDDLGMTSTANIDHNLDLAISACRKESGNRIDSRSQMSVVKEAQNSGYCDESANADIRFIKQVAGYRVWVANGIPNGNTFIDSKLASITRFASLLTPLRDSVFSIGDSIAIFYDLAGPLIAFNRGGAIFVNLRVYETWHDEQVARGEMGDALSFWYFTFGHEIAHNLVDVHNAEHEFYFSALCEKHLKQLAVLL